MANWKKELKFSPEQVIKKIEEMRGNKQGGVFFIATQLSSALLSMVQFKTGVPIEEQSRIITTSIFGSTSPSTSPNTLIGDISRLENEYLKRPFLPFVLATSIPLPRNKQIGSRRIKNSTITFTPNLPKKFQTERLKLEDAAKSYGYNIDAKLGTQAVRVRVLARSNDEAANIALDDIDLLRGMWNLGISYDRLTISTASGVPLPFNKILLDPVASLHYENGDLVTDGFWYKPDIPKNIRTSIDDQSLLKAFKFEKLLRTRLKSLLFGEKLEAFIIQYVNALDSTDWDKAFLKLWRILENATATTEKDSHEDMIQRVAFIFEDYNFHLEILRHLKHQRNQSVHYGSQRPDEGTMVEQIKFYVERFLYFLLFKTKSLTSLEEVRKFLSMPVDANNLQQKYNTKSNNAKELRKELYLIERAAKFRKVEL